MYFKWSIQVFFVNEDIQIGKDHDIKILKYSELHCVNLLFDETHPTLNRFLLSNALLTSFFSCSDLGISLFCSNFFLRNCGFFSKWVVACANWSLFGAWFFIARSWSTGPFFINFGRKIVDWVVRSDLLFDKMGSIIWTAQKLKWTFFIHQYKYSWWT